MIELLIGKPEGSPFVDAYLRGDPGVAPYFSGSWLDPEAYRDMLEGIDRRFDAAARRRALEALDTPGEVGQERLDRWVEGSGVVVTTGQQPGLMGGPLYSLYKGLTTVRLAERLEALLDRPVLPVFWVASEDHDWEESDHTYLIDRSNRLTRVQVPDPGHGNRAIHRVPLDGEVAGMVTQIEELVPNTEFSGSYIELIRDAYAPGVTLADGFRTVLSALLEPLGMLFTDAANSALKAASKAILLAELDGAQAHEEILREDAENLEEAGYSLQVPILEGGVNLFLEGPAGRERLYRHPDGFELHRSGETVTADGIRARVEEDPLALSPNVLLRPLVESTVFPVVSYVAGPGELAYHGQIKRLYEAHGLRMPVIFPRHAVTVVESKIRKVIDKFDLAPEDLRRPHHEIASEIAREEVPEDVRRALGQLKGSIEEGSRKLLDSARDIDSTLQGPVTHARNAALAAFQDVERKIVQSVKRENEIALAQLEKAHMHLFPEGKPQERVLNPLYYLVRYGNPFIEALVHGFEVDLTDGTE